MTAQELNVRNKQEVTSEEPTRPGRTFVPDVDIYETADRLWLWADLPGVDEQSVQVNLVDGVLTLTGQVSVSDYDRLSPVYTEYSVGNYSRRFTVSDAVDPNGITARLTNGVLTLELPKAERAKPRKIDISAN